MSFESKGVHEHEVITPDKYTYSYSNINPQSLTLLPSQITNREHQIKNNNNCTGSAQSEI